MSIADLIAQAISENKNVAVFFCFGKAPELRIIVKPLRWISDNKFEALNLPENKSKHYNIKDIKKVELLETPADQHNRSLITADQTEFQDQQEAELARLEEKLAAQEGLLAEKELSYSTLQGELAAFHMRYMKAIGPSLAKLDEIEAKIAELLYLQNPTEHFYEKAEFAKKRAAETNQESQEAINAPRSKVDFRPTKELKDLYRKVAKKVHPDMGNGEMLEERTALMAEANEAYKNGDMDALQLILNESAYLTKEKESNYLEKKISRVKQKILIIGKRIDQIELEMIGLKASGLYSLMSNFQIAANDGINYLETMLIEIREKISQRQGVLDALLEQSRSGFQKRDFDHSYTKNKPATLEDLRRAIEYAITNRLDIWIRYRDNHGRLTERVVSPYGWDNAFVFVGNCHLRGRDRHFKLRSVLIWQLLDGDGGDW